METDRLKDRRGLPPAITTIVSGECFFVIGGYPIAVVGMGFVPPDYWQKITAEAEEPK